MHQQDRTPWVAQRPATLSLREELHSAIARMRDCPIADLREEWTRCHPDACLPAGLSRDLLIRSIAWTIQEHEYGGVDSALQRELERFAGQLETSGNLDLEREVRLKPGTRLIREWRGATYRVEVTRDGYMLDDQRFASLSHVARAITGTRWSGPRFFGLKSSGAQATQHA